MPKRIKLYLDTSVPNAYFDEKNSHRKEITRQFWLKLKEYEVFISDLVIREIEGKKYQVVEGYQQCVECPCSTDNGCNHRMATGFVCTNNKLVLLDNTDKLQYPLTKEGCTIGIDPIHFILPKGIDPITPTTVVTRKRKYKRLKIVIF